MVWLTPRVAMVEYRKSEMLLMVTVSMSVQVLPPPVTEPTPAVPEATRARMPRR